MHFFVLRGVNDGNDDPPRGSMRKQNVIFFFSDGRLMQIAMEWKVRVDASTEDEAKNRKCPCPTH
jgi:hypothetical protein